MDWLLFLLLPGALLVLCQFPKEDSTRSISIPCTSCDEFVGKKCKKNLGSCQSKYPDFACQTKEVYTSYFTGDYVYQYSILGCPKRCVEYVRLTSQEKHVIFCCNQSYCNSLLVKDELPFLPISREDLD